MPAPVPGDWSGNYVLISVRPTVLFEGGDPSEGRWALQPDGYSPPGMGVQAMADLPEGFKPITVLFKDPDHLDDWAYPSHVVSFKIVGAPDLLEPISEWNGQPQLFWVDVEE